MDMVTYLSEIEHAVSTLIDALWIDVDKLKIQSENTAKLERQADAGYSRSQFFALNPDLDDEGLGTAIYWDTYFGADKERYHSSTVEDQLKARIQTIEFSNGALAGSILQYAKQGISIVHQGLANCPNGRQLGNQALKTVIWQGRNQAIHWEEGRLRQEVINCFNILANDYDHQFQKYHTECLALPVLNILGWRRFQDFHRDLLSIGMKNI
jgi:hypothetical protein